MNRPLHILAIASCLLGGCQTAQEIRYMREQLSQEDVREISACVKNNIAHIKTIEQRRWETPFGEVSIDIKKRIIEVQTKEEVLVISTVFLDGQIQTPKASADIVIFRIRHIAQAIQSTCTEVSQARTKIALKK